MSPKRGKTCTCAGKCAPARKTHIGQIQQQQQQGLFELKN